MNIYEKLMNVRVALSKEGIKKSGENTFNNSKYYELEDFLPTAQKLLLENKLAGFCNIKESAKLTILDFEKEDSKIEFELEIKEANIRGAATIQNLGGTVTYFRRYLWMLALEITESDSVDTNKAKEFAGGTTKDVANNVNNQPNLESTTTKTNSNQKDPELYTEKDKDLLEIVFDDLGLKKCFNGFWHWNLRYNKIDLTENIEINKRISQYLVSTIKVMGTDKQVEGIKFAKNTEQLIKYFLNLKL